MSSYLCKKSAIRLVPCILGLLSFLVFKQRLYSYQEPVECDTALFSVLAREWRLGRELYSDLWDNKPPGIILTYAAAQQVVGSGPNSILLLATFSSIFTLFGIYFAAFWMTGDWRSGVWGAAFWTLVNADPYLEANQPLAEVFVNVVWAWAMAWAIRALKKEGSSKDLVVAGCLLALASFYKHHLVVSNVLIALSIVGAMISHRTFRNWGSSVCDLWKLLSPSFLLWIVVFSYFAVTGRFLIFWNTLITYSRYYAEGSGAHGLTANILSSIYPSTLRTVSKQGVFYPLIPLALAALPGLFLGLKAKDRGWLLWLGFITSAWIGIALPGRLYPHYYQLLLPPLAIGAGAAGSLPMKELKWRPAAWISVVWILALFIVLLFREIPLYRLEPEEWSRLKYGEVYITVKKMGEEIGRNLLPQETFYEIGYEPGLYYYSRRRPPTGDLLADHWETGPFHKSFSEKIIHDLAAHKPELLVTTRFWMANPENLRQPVLQWCLARYRPFSSEFAHGPFLLYARQGGRFDGLLSGQKRALPGKVLHHTQ